MSRKKSKTVLGGNGPVTQDTNVMLDGITLEELRPIMSEALDKAFDEPTENMRRASQCLTGLEQEARQPRLATEADVLADTKNHKRMEDAVADQAKHRDSCSAKRIQAGPTSSTSFGMKAEPLTLPRRDDVLVDKDAAASKPCLSPVDMRTLTAAGDFFQPIQSLQRRGSYFTSYLFGFARLRRRILGRHQFNTLLVHTTTSGR